MSESRSDAMYGPSPYDLLLPYQRKWVTDAARFKVWLKARQIGGSFAAAFEVVVDAMLHRGDWLLVSASERQSRELLEKVRQVSQIFAEALTWNGHDGAFDSAAGRVNYANGARVIALAANPATVRGYSASVLLDEFAFHPDAREIWKALFPVISNPLKGHLKLRVVSTAAGRNSLFYELIEKTDIFSLHRTTVYDATHDGLPLNLAELRSAIGDSDAWAQEYECQFLDQSSQLLRTALIDGVESAEASLDGWDNDTVNPLYLGIDVGRHQDLTVAWLLEKVGDVLWTREVLALSRTAFPEQERALLPRLQRASYAAIDATGIGGPLAENLAASCQYKLDTVVFTADRKRELFDRLRRSCEERSLRIPAALEIRDDLASLNRVVTSSGAIKYYAPRRRDGHADRTTALALALHAASRDHFTDAWQRPGGIRLGQGHRAFRTRWLPAARNRTRR